MAFGQSVLRQLSEFDSRFQHGVNKGPETIITAHEIKKAVESGVDAFMKAYAR
jgi:hypothetical protein